MREMGGAVCSRLMKKECNVGMVIVRMWLTNSAGYERRFRLLEVSNGKPWEGLERSGYEGAERMKAMTAMALLEL